MKLTERRKAVSLREKGLSLNEISERVSASKSSIALWVKDLKLSREARARIESLKSAGQRAAQISHFEHTRRNLEAANTEAQGLVRSISVTPEIALVTSSLLYWCEGAKDANDKTFTFSNSDPQLVRAFMRLLRLAIPIDERKFRVRMHLHEYHSESRQRRFWTEVTGIPESQFTKTYWKPHTGITIKNEYPGCVHISYFDVVVSRKISATARMFLTRVVE